MATAKTYHQGAEAERRAFRAHLRSMIRQTAKMGDDKVLSPIGPYLAGWYGEILEWVNGRSARYRASKGGL